jgi:hypothetical protein
VSSLSSFTLAAMAKEARDIAPAAENYVI